MFITYFDLKKMSIEYFNNFEEHKMEIYDFFSGILILRLYMCTEMSN